MSLTFDTTLGTSMVDLIMNAVDAGAGPGKIRCYTGAKPAHTATAATGTLLAEFILNDPAAAAAIAGVATWDFTPSVDTTALADGNAGWFRVLDSSNNPVFDGEIGTTGGVEKDLNFHYLGWLAGGTLSITAGSVSAAV